MKNYLLIALCCLFFASCGKSDEEKLNDLIAEATKSSLYIPESYDPVSLECDTLGRNIITEANIKKAVKFVEVMKEAKNQQHDFEYNNEQKEFWRGQYGGFYNDYSRKAQSAENKKIQKIGEARAIISDLYKQYYAPREFVGFLADHKFRAKNNAGQVCFGEYVFILNKEKTEVLAAIDAQDEKTLYFFQLTGALQELGEGIDTDNLSEQKLFEISENIKSKFELQYP